MQIQKMEAALDKSSLRKAITLALTGEEKEVEMSEEAAIADHLIQEAVLRRQTTKIDLTITEEDHSNNICHRLK
jgi:hypothetical protein